MSDIVEMQARIDLYELIAIWIRELHAVADEEVAPLEVVADRLRHDLVRQADQEAVRRMLAAATAVARYVVDCVLCDAKQVGIRTPHKAGHA